MRGQSAASASLLTRHQWWLLGVSYTLRHLTTAYLTPWCMCGQQLLLPISNLFYNICTADAFYIGRGRYHDCLSYE